MCPRGLSVLKEVLQNLKCRNPKMPYYAVARGRDVGVFQSWDVCQELTSNFKGAKYKKFDNKESAWDFVKQHRFRIGKPIDETDEMPLAKQSKIEKPSLAGKIKNVDNEDASNSRFDFAAFNVRLTNLENSYQEKIRSLEERLSALENERSGCPIESSEQLEVKDDNKSARAPSVGPAKRKLLDSAGKIVKPRAYSTSALKKLKLSGDDVEQEAASSSSASRDSVPFKLDEENYVVVYTDGACSKNGCGPESAKAGIGIWFNHEHPLNKFAPVTGRSTNNVAELQAATVAANMAAAAGVKNLCIVTDSMFVINCMTEWLGNWKQNNWKTARGEPVINKLEILELEKACKSLQKVKWVYVRGHQGNYGNEQADKLARQGAELYKLPNGNSDECYM